MANAVDIIGGELYFLFFMGFLTGFLLSLLLLNLLHELPGL